VIILTLNEEANLGAALDSVCGWADEVFVVDSFSCDRTVDLALSRHARDNVRVVQHRFEDYGAQWNWALDKLPIRTEWVLKLDADERVPEAFKEEFERLASNPTDLNVAYYFRRSIHFLGQSLRWGGTLSNWDIRVWKHSHGRFEARSVNEHLIVKGGSIGSMVGMIEHHDLKDFSEWLTKQNRYSSMEALIRINGEHASTVPRFFGSRHERTNWLRNFYFRVPLHNVALFFYLAIFRLGFLDGVNGIRYSYLRAMIRHWNDLKVAEFLLTGRKPTLERRQPAAPHPDVALSALQSFVDCRKDANALARGVDLSMHDRS
jgi:glycosyltransferase involved in cell wall biosynthesis